MKKAKKVDDYFYMTIVNWLPGGETIKKNGQGFRGLIGDGGLPPCLVYLYPLLPLVVDLPGRLFIIVDDTGEEIV